MKLGSKECNEALKSYETKNLAEELMVELLLMVELIDEMEGFQRQGRILLTLKKRGYISEPTYLLVERNVYRQYEDTVSKIDRLQIDILEEELFNI